MNNRLCILDQMVQAAQNIEKTSWKDQTFREIAKTYASDGHFEDALSIIDQISTPDTKAMTIRGIGMAIASREFSQEELNTMFAKLRQEAENIEHPPSYAIALTYIAMAQAFAGDNSGAWKTAADMENAALRNKAYGETAEIQAEQGHYKAAQISIEKIGTASFRNKAYSIVSRILADNALFNDAYAAANSITNAYKKSQSLQYLLDAQSAHDAASNEQSKSD